MEYHFGDLRRFTSNPQNRPRFNPIISIRTTPVSRRITRLMLSGFRSTCTSDTSICDHHALTLQRSSFSSKRAASQPHGLDKLAVLQPYEPVRFHPEGQPSLFACQPEVLSNRHAFGRKTGLSLWFRRRVLQQSCARLPWPRRCVGRGAECVLRRPLWRPWRLPAVQQRRGGLSRQPQVEPRIRQCECG